MATRQWLEQFSTKCHLHRQGRGWSLCTSTRQSLQVQNPLQDRATIQGHILNVRIPLPEMNEECSSKPKGFQRLWSLVSFNQGDIHAAQQTHGAISDNLYALKSNFMPPREAPTESTSLTLLWPALCLCLDSWCMASPSALVQQPCILCRTIRNWDNHTVCIYSALTLHTVWALCYHFNMPARMIILWKSALLVKSKVSEFFMVCLPLTVTGFWSCLIGWSGKQSPQLFQVMMQRPTVYMLIFS